MGIILRPYQQEFIGKIRREMVRGNHKICGVAPCGAGKTIMTGWMIREAEKRGKRSIFFVHRKELIDQTSETFTKLDIPHGIIAAGVPFQPELPVQIASVQTLAQRLSKVPKPDFLICDECHHILAETYKKIINYWHDAYLLGVTATPERRGGIRLGDVFDSMVIAPSVNELIKWGNLTPFVYYAQKPNNLSFDDVKIKYGEYDNRQLEEKMTDKGITGQIVQHYEELAGGKSAICYCINIEHSKYVADNFNAAGISAAHCDGETSASERKRIVDDFRRGKIKVLCNAELFGEGFDVPNMDAVILARPTTSLTLYIQQAMRPMRPDPNNPDKVALIIDHVGNVDKFNLPDEPRDWSLDPNLKKPSQAKLKKCPICQAVLRQTAKICPQCKYIFPVDLREPREFNFEESDEVLKQIISTSRDNIQSSSIKRRLTKIEELLEFAAKSHYKKGWAAIEALKYVKSYADCLHIANVMNYAKGWAWYKWNEIKNSRGLTV